MTATMCDSVCDALQLSLVVGSQGRLGTLGAATKVLQLTNIEFEETGSHRANKELHFLKARNVTILTPTPGQGQGDTCHTSLRDRGQQDHHTHTTYTISGSTSSSSNPELPQPKRILYPITSVRLGWDSGRQMCSGMYNLGNTCYLNSTLQALFHVPAFANWLLSESHDSDCDCVICGVKKTLLDAQRSSNPIKPYRVFSKLRDICSSFTPMNQEDAHEFLRYLINSMVKTYFRKSGIIEKELDTYSKETTPLHQILGGYLKSAVRCLTCAHVSITYQHFQDLLVDSCNANTLDEALRIFFSKEILDDCGYKCEACNKKVSATKQFFIERPPLVLCIALKRFSVTGGKLSKRVQYRTKICIKNYLVPRSNNPPSLTYRLVSVINHIGNSQDSGHYTAYGLCPDGNNFYLFDDSSSWLVPPANIVSANACILFYELDKSDSLVLQGPLSPFKSFCKRKQEETVVCNKSNNNIDKFKKHSLKFDSALEGSVMMSPPNSKESSPNSSLSSNSSETNNNFSTQKSVKFVISVNESKSIQNSYDAIPSTSSDVKNIASGSKNDYSYGNDKKHDSTNSARKGDQKQYIPNKSLVLNKSGSSNENEHRKNGNTSDRCMKTDLSESCSSRSVNFPHNKAVIRNRYENGSHNFKSADERNGSEDLSRSSSPKTVKSVTYTSKVQSSDSVNIDKDDERRKRHKLLLLSQKSICIKREVTMATVPGWEVSKETPVSLPSSSRNGIANSRLTESEDSANHKTNSITTNGHHSISNGGHSSNIHNNNNRSENIKSNGDGGASSSGTSNSSSGSNGISDKKDIVSHLMRQSHTGYGAPVGTWNGTHSQLDRQVYEDKRNEKKRALEADDEMDHGRQKKVKRPNDGYYPNSSCNPYQKVQKYRTWHRNNRHDNGYKHYNESHRPDYPHYNRFNNKSGKRYNNDRDNFDHRGSHYNRQHQFRRNC